MKKRTITVGIIAALLSVLLSGCQANGGTDGGTPEPSSASVLSAEGESAKAGEPAKADETIKETNKGEESVQENEDPATQNPSSSLPYQFVRTHGIFQSEHPVYELDTVIQSDIPQKELELSLTTAICHNQELIVSVVVEDFGEVKRIAPDEEPPRGYMRLRDGTAVVSENYQRQFVASVDGLCLMGTGIPEDGIKPLESMCAADSVYFEVYGTVRYVLEARFQLPSGPGDGDKLSNYALRLLDFETPLEFSLRRAPEYDTLEELAAAEHGGIDTHDGMSVISMGEKVEDGIVVSYYACSDEEGVNFSITYKPPNQEIEYPTISSGEKQYQLKGLPANPYWNNLGVYRLSDVKLYGWRYRYLFDVPQREQDGDLQVNIPGITFLDREESAPVTLTIPDDYEELNQDIQWDAGSVRILGITRMKEPQTVDTTNAQGEPKVIERPAVYIDVEAVHEDKDIALKALLCQRKRKWGGWERQRYDFDAQGNLSGFRIFYEEGDSEVTLKFHGAAFYWNQPFVMELPLAD